MVQIRLAQASDARLHWEHLGRIAKESGRNGDFIFSPSEEFEVPLEAYVESYAKNFSKTVHECGWQRTWVIADSEKIYGDLHLVHRPPLKSNLHRATLMMGMERSVRGQGFGTRLMTEAVTWAKSQPTLEWLQLFVFEGNEPAKALYRKFGFVETGTTPDMFRVHGKQIADTAMVLKLS